MTIQELKEQINQMIAGGEYDSILPMLLLHKEVTEKDNDLATVCYLCKIYEHEKKAGCAVIFSKISDMEELLERYTRLKFYLRRIDFDVMGNQIETFYEFLTTNRISSYELLQAVDFSVINREKVLKTIRGEMKQADILHMDREKSMVCVENIDMSAECEDEICFIICTNDQLYAQECIYYINRLNVPEGCRTDILTVEEADSLASGYNEAMRYSKAKYKVYLHHDTFIIYPDFIRGCLELFRNNPQIGMIGNIGAQKMPASGVMWDVKRYGMLYQQNIYETKLLVNPVRPEIPYLEVEAIDGFLMVTQYDIPWREDLFTKWDFYDCSQSMEFIRRGYQIVIPNMKFPWCVHDCGFMNLANYDKEREKFVREYLQRGR